MTQKFFLTQNFSGCKIFWHEKFVLTQKPFKSKFFLTQNFSRPKIFHDTKFVGEKIFMETQIFWPKIFVKLQHDLEPNLNEIEQTWTSRVRSWLCFPMSQEQEEEEPHLILPYRRGLQVSEIKFFQDPNFYRTQNLTKLFRTCNFFVTRNFSGPKFFQDIVFFWETNFLGP